MISGALDGRKAIKDIPLIFHCQGRALCRTEPAQYIRQFSLENKKLSPLSIKRESFLVGKLAGPTRFELAIFSVTS